LKKRTKKLLPLARGTVVALSDAMLNATPSFVSAMVSYRFIHFAVASS
jgi:hypothetical protein